MAGGALALPSGSVAAVCGLQGTVAIVDAATAKNLLKVRIFGDFGDGDTHGGDGS
jgi:hypothetical protein